MSIRAFYPCHNVLSIAVLLRLGNNANQLRCVLRDRLINGDRGNISRGYPLQLGQSPLAVVLQNQLERLHCR